LRIKRDTFYAKLTSLHVAIVESKQEITNYKKRIEKLEKISSDAQSALDGTR